MRVETLGDGTPDVAAVGAIHGDEPCGSRAIDRFLESSHAAEVERPVKLIVANERALEAGKRYVDADLNRVFPGDPEGCHEERLAHELLAEIEGCVTLGFHSTVSFDRPFGTLADPTPEKARVMRALPMDHAADFTGAVEGRSVNLPRFMNVEAGLQGTDSAAENAYDCLLAYLREMDVLPEDSVQTPTSLYRVFETIRKRPGLAYRVHVENFERVPENEVFAESITGDHALRADREFWPVLLSADGHETLLGYRAEKLGEIASVASAQ